MGLEEGPRLGPEGRLLGAVVEIHGHATPRTRSRCGSRRRILERVLVRPAAPGARRAGEAYCAAYCLGSTPTGRGRQPWRRPWPVAGGGAAAAARSAAACRSARPRSCRGPRRRHRLAPPPRALDVPSVPPAGHRGGYCDPAAAHRPWRIGQQFALVTAGRPRAAARAGSRPPPPNPAVLLSDQQPVPRPAATTRPPDGRPSRSCSTAAGARGSRDHHPALRPGPSAGVAGDSTRR